MGHKNIHIYSQIVILSRILFKCFISSIENSYCFCIGNISFFGMYFLRICESLQMFLCNKWEYPCAFNEIPTFISSTWNNHYLFVGMGVEWGAGATPLSAEFWFIQISLWKSNQILFSTDRFCKQQTLAANQHFIAAKIFSPWWDIYETLPGKRTLWIIHGAKFLHHKIKQGHKICKIQPNILKDEGELKFSFGFQLIILVLARQVSCEVSKWKCLSQLMYLSE